MHVELGGPSPFTSLVCHSEKRQSGATGHLCRWRCPIQGKATRPVKVTYIGSRPTGRAPTVHAQCHLRTSEMVSCRGGAVTSEGSCGDPVALSPTPSLLLSVEDAHIDNLVSFGVSAASAC